MIQYRVWRDRYGILDIRKTTTNDHSGRIESVDGHNENPCAFDLEELRAILRSMLAATDQPILDEREIMPW